MTDSKKVLYIGGHGKIGLLTTPKLVEKGHAVHSLVRNPDYKEELEGLGATPVIADITKLSSQDWAELADGFDVVVWGAGNGGRGAAALTFAVDQDGAIAAVEGLESLGDEAPRFIMISYMAQPPMRSKTMVALGTPTLSPRRTRTTASTLLRSTPSSWAQACLLRTPPPASPYLTRAALATATLKPHAS